MAQGNHQVTVEEIPLERTGGVTLRHHYKPCPKLARHPEYIPVPDFCLKHLPLQCRSDCMLAIVNALVKLTVLMKVDSTSDLRAVHYPHVDKNASRQGSGCVVEVRGLTEMDKEDCPCEECQRSEKSRQQFGKITVQTSAQIVFDIEEGRNTVCYFDFDSDSAALSSCPNLTTAVSVNSNVQDDVSFVTFLTHDLEYIEQLDQNLKHFRRLCDQTRREADYNISTLCRKYQETVEECSELMDRWRNVTNEDVERMMQEQKRKYTVQSEDGKSSYWRLLECRMRGGDVWKQRLSDMNDTFEWCSHLMEGVRELMDKYSSYINVFGDEGVQDKCRFYHQQFELTKCHLQDYSTRDECDTTTDLFCERTFYEPCRPLAIILSHPHGFRKQISIGQVIERHADACRPGYAKYTYTVNACPEGSAGAPVFILGRLGKLHLIHSHSLSSQTDTNTSGVLPDL